MKRTVLIALILPVVFQQVFAEEELKPRLGKYSCIVQAAYPNLDWAKSYVGSRLEYDADRGTLHLASLIDIDGESTWLPPQRICSRLIVQTEPSNETHLHAIQFDPASPGTYRPFVAWLMIKTIDNEYTLDFKFFSTGIEGVVTGTCTHL